VQADFKVAKRSTYQSYNRVRYTKRLTGFTMLLFKLTAYPLHLVNSSQLFCLRNQESRVEHARQLFRPNRAPQLRLPGSQAPL